MINRSTIGRGSVSQIEKWPTKVQISHKIKLDNVRMNADKQQRPTSIQFERVRDEKWLTVVTNAHTQNRHQNEKITT